MMTISIKGTKLILILTENSEAVRTVTLTDGTEILQEEYDRTLKAIIDRINFFTPKMKEADEG